ncbi:MAG: Tm-1-like ATP-binding domain-containing protein [Deltaproteobacteria bacterium]|nr:Tm-1-like ATP-binding domain-containing protein [Deltaproteobacteria bacterium]
MKVRGQTQSFKTVRPGARTLIDFSLHELTDHRFGGDYDAGPRRAKALTPKGIATLLIRGNTDFIVTGPITGAEQRYPCPCSRFNSHNVAVTTVRTFRERPAEIAREVAAFCRVAKDPVEVTVPKKGISAFDHPEGPLYEPQGPRFFLQGLEGAPADGMSVRKPPAHINDEAFSDAILEALDRVMAAR